MGNRDINKLRISEEMGVWSSDALPLHGGVYWLRETKMIGDPDCTIGVPSKSKADRLKWMLQKTMGSVDAFELRRNELQRERVAILNSTLVSPSSRTSTEGFIDDETAVTDDEVADSYMLSCDPNDGIMCQYLTRAKLIIKLGPALFMHGALPFSPDKKQDHFPSPWVMVDEKKSYNGQNSLADWIDLLNKFADEQIAAWREYGRAIQSNATMQNNGVWATTGGYTNSTVEGKAFGKLLQYGMNTLPDRTKNPSVVYSSWMDDGMPRKDMLDPHWIDYLKSHGLQVIATGHQPVGDMPWPIQIRDTAQRSCWILPCDTSFSGDTKWVNVDAERKNLGRGKGLSGRGDIAVR